MGIADHIEADWHASLAALAWQVDLGVTEVLGDAPINRYDLPESLKPAAAAVQAAPLASAKPAAPSPVADAPKVDVAALAQQIAERCGTVAALQEALSGFEHCSFRKSARNFVFGQGNPEARVLILSEAPNTEEDREGRAFVGPMGDLFDKMFGAIGLSRTADASQDSLYIMNALPWRAIGGADQEHKEITALRPFVQRHIALINPAVIVTLGNGPLLSLTGGTLSLRARGTWAETMGKPLLPMLHPSALMRNPAAKREAWADLLALQAKLRRMQQA